MALTKNNLMLIIVDMNKTLLEAEKERDNTKAEIKNLEERLDFLSNTVLANRASKIEALEYEIILLEKQLKELL